MIEHDDEFEGVGAHPLNPRFDWLESEHGDRPVRASLLPVARRLQGIRGFMDATIPLEGHDGSHHQFDAGPVDLDVLASVTWIIWWKATQSTSYVDPTFARVWVQRRKFVVSSAYHWLSSTTDPEKQADHFIRAIEAQGGLGPGSGVMGDFEEGGITVPWCVGFKRPVEKYFKRPLQNYSGLYVAGGSIWNSDELRESPYGPFAPMHLAAYISEARLRDIMLARKAKPYHAWQYSSDGPVPGITGRADMNGRINRLMYEQAARVPSKPEEDDEMPEYFARNAEPRQFEGVTYPAGAIKFERVRVADGSARLRRLSGGELRLMGHGNVTATFGEPMTNDEINEIGEWTEADATPAPPPVNVEVDFPRYQLTAIAEPIQ